MAKLELNLDPVDLGMIADETHGIGPVIDRYRTGEQPLRVSPEYVPAASAVRAGLRYDDPLAQSQTAAAISSAIASLGILGHRVAEPFSRHLLSHGDIQAQQHALAAERLGGPEGRLLLRDADRTVRRTGADLMALGNRLGAEAFTPFGGLDTQVAAHRQNVARYDDLANRLEVNSPQAALTDMGMGLAPYGLAAVPVAGPFLATGAGILDGAASLNRNFRYASQTARTPGEAWRQAFAQTGAEFVPGAKIAGGFRGAAQAIRATGAPPTLLNRFGPDAAGFAVGEAFGLVNDAGR